MSNFGNFVSTVFGGAWRLFELNVPGFSFSYGDVIVACLLASGSLFLLRMILGTSTGSNSQGRSTRNPKISEERKNDTK